MTPELRVAHLHEALARHVANVSPHYDEALNDITQRARERGSLGKADIGGLVAWKRLNGSTRWMNELMSTSDEVVREATRRARVEALDEQIPVEAAASSARSMLSHIAGFRTGDALASAVILALAPHRMAVYDRRAQVGLERVGLSLTAAPGRYGRYMALVAEMGDEAAQHGVPLSARQIDLALFGLGGS